MNLIQEFVQKRLTPTPLGSAWISTVISTQDVSGQIVDSCRQAQGSCQAIPGSLLSKMDPAALMAAVRSMMSKKQHVVLTLDTDQLLQLFDQLGTLQHEDLLAAASDQETATNGRLFINFISPDPTQPPPEIQRISDYSITITN